MKIHFTRRMAALLLCCGLVGEPLYAATAVDLIAGPIQNAGADTPPTGERAKRDVVVTLNPNALALMAPDSMSGSAGPQLRLSLFPDAVFDLEGKGSELKWNNTAVTKFAISGDPEGSAVIAVTEGVLQGTVTTGTHDVYRIQPAGGDAYLVEELDHSKFPDCPITNVNEVDTGPAVAGDTPPSASADSGALVKVLVAYTQAAETAAGGPAGIANVIATAESETNTGYTTSGVNFQISVVHTVKVSYVESAANPFYDDLDAITGTSDGALDEIHGLRDTYHADLVVLLIENSSLCGLGWLPNSVSSANSAYGFSVTARNCATGYYSFAHEMGHNMGVRHDVYVDSSTAPYAYGHGYTNTTAWIRSIMAYNTACSAAGNNCQRVNHWSAADRLYNGTTTIGASSTATNNLALSNSANAIANYRIDPHTVSTSAGVGGAISPTSATVEHGATTSFTVSTDTGYDIQSVTGCGGTLSVNTYTTGAINADCTVTASFALKNYPVSTSAGAGGSIAPTSANVNHGATEAFTVTASSGYAIQSVTGCGGTLSGTTYTTGAITGACAVSATFTLLAIDSDSDGLTDSQEAMLGTDPNTPNTVIDGSSSGSAVVGAGGSEVILAVRANTSVNAGDGDDVVASAQGRQVITLGGGNDVVVWIWYPDSDVINDFTLGQDRLDVRNLLAGSSTLNYTAGGNPLQSGSGHITCALATGGAYVKYDRDGTAGSSYSAVNYALVKGAGVTPAALCTSANFVY